MTVLSRTLKNRSLRSARVRSRVSGNSTRPRLHVHISNRHINAQIINDDTHTTLVQVSTATQKSEGNTMTERAIWAGTQIAKVAKAKKIKLVVFDRGSKLYHGRIKALADAARKEGLEF